MKLHRSLVLALCLALCAALSIGGTLAYLTDRDSEVNVFPMGDVRIDLTEDFEQGAQLIPGLNIQKMPVVTNIGTVDAYVWMTFSLPSAFDQAIQGTEEGSVNNRIHWNPMGATTEGYVTETRVNNAITAGYLPEGITADEIINSHMTWNVFNSIA